MRPWKGERKLSVSQISRILSCILQYYFVHNSLFMDIRKNSFCVDRHYDHHSSIWNSSFPCNIPQ